MIALAEFFFFHILVCERLNHADSGKCVLQTGIDISDFLPVFHKGRLHSAVLAHRKCKHAKHQKQKWNCQLPVDQEEEDERSDDLDHGNKQILRSMMRKFCNIKTSQRQVCSSSVRSCSDHNKKKKVFHSGQKAADAYPVPYKRPSYAPDS